MPDWRSELETLLSQLHVTLDHSQDSDRPAVIRQAPLRYDGQAGDAEAEASYEPDPPLADELVDEGDEVSAVRSEIEATVARVIALSDNGCIDSTLRDDVIFVLQALTRPVPQRILARATSKQQEDARQEWQLTSAAAVLRFCRIVLALTQALSSEAGC
jgi:hypothetical protein